MNIDKPVVKHTQKDVSSLHVAMVYHIRTCDGGNRLACARRFVSACARAAPFSDFTLQGQGKQQLRASN